MGDTNTLCDCGHVQGWHDPISGHVGKCLWPNGWPEKRECDCDAFTGPAVVDAVETAPSSTDLPDAVAAWEAWLNSPEQEFKANHDRASFMAGYRRALEDAADAVAHVRDRGLPLGVASHPTHPYIEDWLRARAADADPRETES